MKIKKNSSYANFDATCEACYGFIINNNHKDADMIKKSYINFYDTNIKTVSEIYETKFYLII